MSNNFRACCVNGLSNALYQKMKQTTSNNELNSEACFHFLKDDETYNLKAQLENKVMSGNFTLSALSFGKLDLLLPTELYSLDSKSQSDDKTYASIHVPAFVTMTFDTTSPVFEWTEMFIYGVVGLYAFETKMEIDGMYFTISDPIWHKIVLDSNTSETAFPANKEVKRINGLYNAFASSLNQVENGDIMNSDVLFDYLINDEVYNLKNQIENAEFGMESMQTLMMLASLPMSFKLPAVEYDSEINAWSDQLTYVNIPFYCYPIDLENKMIFLDSHAGTLATNIGKYFCQMDVALQQSYTGSSMYDLTFSVTVDSITWKKLAFDA